jgi:cysteine synthase
MARLRRRAAESVDMVYLGQYDNENNWKAHATWTGPQILKQLPEVTVFSTTVGTGGQQPLPLLPKHSEKMTELILYRLTGCITGTGVALKSQKPSIKVLG